MNGYQDLNTNIEHSRNSLRRIARNDDHEFSRESIVNLMEKFVKTVNVMDDTILVPCRLMDRAVGDASDTVQSAPKSTNSHINAAHGGHGKRKGTSVHENLQASDLHNLYTMLNDVKVDLLWGRNSEEQPEEMAAKAAAAGAKQQSPAATGVDSVDGKTTLAPAAANAIGATAKGHVRRPSTVSVASSNSTNTLSDSDSDISNENDSGIESESTRAGSGGASSKGDADAVDKSSELARQYRQHLLGLYRCLEQMTEAANYLTNRYQSDVGPA